MNLTNQWAGQPWSSKNGQFEMALPDWSQSVNPAFVARLRLGNWSTVRMQATASDGNALLAADFGELIEFYLPGENYASGFPSHALQGREQTLAFMETADRLYAFGSNDLNSAVLPAPASDFQSSHQQLLSYKKRNDYPAAHRRRMEGATSGSILRLIAVAPYERNVNPEVLEAVMVQDRILPKR
ncbi:hypothetical protein ACQ859_02720 [Roseateles chitinivorans]|uniref:hypothetical protein n=1 Tax=Roseateles chitinivorans TaxID=2917965 RepID=UPI003D67D332